LPSQKINSEPIRKFEHIAPSVAISLSKLIRELFKADRQFAGFNFFLPLSHPQSKRCSDRAFLDQV
jgi:hypothetical protein